MPQVGIPLPPVPGTLYKRAAEVRRFDFRFGNFQEFAETIDAEAGIASATVTYQADDTALTVGLPVIGGSNVQFILSNGSPTIVYRLTCQAVTAPSGYVLEQDGFLQVLND